MTFGRETQDAIKKLDQRNDPMVKAARENLAMNRKLASASAVSFSFQDNEETTQFPGSQLRLYMDGKLTSSGNTTTFSPAEGKKLSLYNDEFGWQDHVFESDIPNDTTGATSGRKYDFFVYFDPATEAYVLDKVIWTDDTTRSVALDTQDGASLLSTDHTWRWVGWGYYNGTAMQVSSGDGTGMTWYGTGNPNDPTGSDPFTGMILNATGLYGYNAGTLEVYINNLGQIVAGGDNVKISADGITLSTTAVGSEGSIIKWLGIASPATKVMEIYPVESGTYVQSSITTQAHGAGGVVNAQSDVVASGAGGPTVFLRLKSSPTAALCAIELTGAKVAVNKQIDQAQGADIASATTTDIGAATGNYVKVTGTTTITGLGSVQAGTQRDVEFTGALTLTHNGTSLILPGAANILTVAGDMARFISLGSGNWKCESYERGGNVPPTTVTGTGKAVYGTTPTITSGMVIDDNGSPAAIALKNGATSRGDLAMPEGAGQYAAGAAEGDIVLRSNASKLIFDTNNGSGTSSLTIQASNGIVSMPNGIGNGAPVTETAATRTLLITDNYLICNRAGTITITLLSGAAYTGKVITIKTITANTVVSNASNVIPQAGGATGAAILAATAGKWARLVYNGTNWEIMESN